MHTKFTDTNAYATLDSKCLDFRINWNFSSSVSLEGAESKEWVLGEEAPRLNKGFISPSVKVKNSKDGAAKLG